MQNNRHYHTKLVSPKFSSKLGACLVADLRIGQRGHGLGIRAFGAQRNSFLWRLNIN